MKQLGSLVYSLYERSGERARRWFGLLKRVALLPCSLRLRCCRFEIRVGDANPPHPAIYIGEGLSLSYYLHLLRPNTPQPRADRIPLWRLRQTVRAAAAEAPVVLVEVNQLLGRFLPGGGLTAEAWVRHETDLRGALYQHRRRGIERSFGQQVRSHGYTCRFSHEPAVLEQFHRDYYVPYVTWRHGHLAAPRSLGELRRALRSGFLLQVWKEQQWVSGLLVSRLGQRRIQLWAVGRRCGEGEDPHDGAVSATYYFLFEWAVEQDLDIVDFLGTRPHLGDGVFRHKSLWAAEPKADPWHHTAIVFYVDGRANLPAAVTQQLVRSERGFVTIGERLNPPR